MMSTIRGASRLYFERQNRDPQAVAAVIIELIEKSIECLNSRGAPQGYGRKFASELVNILSLLNLLLQTKLTSPNAAWQENSQAPGALTFRLLVAPDGLLLQLQWFLGTFLSVLVDCIEEAEVNVARVTASPGAAGKGPGLPFVWVLRKQKVRKLLGMMEKYRTCLLLALQNDHVALGAEINTGEVYTDSEDDMDIDDDDTHEEFRGQLEGPLAEVQQKERILEWLSPLDFQSRQKDCLGLYLHGTSTDFLHHELFRSWMMGNQKTLYCPGIPGAGKTVTVSAVVNLLEETYAEDLAIGLAYFYCDHAYQEQEQSAVNIVRSIIQQLALKHTVAIAGDDTATLAFLDCLMTLYETPDEKPPTLKQCLAMLRYVITLFTRVFIVIDGIGECDEIKLLLPELLTYTSTKGTSGVSLLATSREINEITRLFEGLPRLEVRASEQDVRRYVEYRIDKARNSPLGLLLLDPGNRTVRKVPQAAIALRQFITNQISQKAQGTFLLPKLHMDLLTHAKRATVKRVQQEVEGLPQTIAEAYELTIELIERQGRENSELAKRAIAWVAFSVKPLTVGELQHALAVESSDATLERRALKLIDHDSLPGEDILISLCGGLLFVDKECDRVRLVHGTAREYFIQNSERIFGHTSVYTSLAATCLAYLSLDIFEKGCLTDVDAIRRRHRDFPFLHHAAHHWAQYICLEPGAEVALKNLINAFLDDNRKVESFLQFKEYYPTCFDDCQWVVKSHSREIFQHDAPGILVAASLGLAATVQFYIEERNINCNTTKNHKGQNPLSIAAEKGYGSVMKVLLARPEITPNTIDNSGFTPLAMAAWVGHESAVQLLLARDDVNPEASDGIGGLTPLALAAWCGHDAVVKLLLARDDINPEHLSQVSFGGKTPLALAASAGHDCVVATLLADKRVHPNPRSQHGETPLTLAADLGKASIVRLLLESPEVNPMAQDNFGRSPISHAAAQIVENRLLDCAEVVKVLLTRPEVDPDCKDKSGHTPLSLASQAGNVHVVRLLLSQNNVNPESQDTEGRTPFWWACSKGHAAVVDLFLSTTKINPDAKDSEGQSPLAEAAWHNHEAITKTLLARNDVDADSKNRIHVTPLIYAASGGHVNVVKLFLSRPDVNPDARNVFGFSPLAMAAYEGWANVVQILLAHQGVDANVVNEDGYTPLAMAAERGHEAVVRVLLAAVKTPSEAIALLDSKNIHGKTAHDMAVANKRQAVAKLLEEYRARITS